MYDRLFGLINQACSICIIADLTLCAIIPRDALFSWWTLGTFPTYNIWEILLWSLYFMSSILLPALVIGTCLIRLTTHRFTNASRLLIACAAQSLILCIIWAAAIGGFIIYLPTIITTYVTGITPVAWTLQDYPQGLMILTLFSLASTRLIARRCKKVAS